MKRKRVYIALSADLLHPGHLNVIRKGAELGDVIIGLLTDSAVASYKRMPYLSYEQRLTVVDHIKGVTEIIPQHTLDYTANLDRVRPDYVVHGDDWRQGFQRNIRQKVLDLLAGWGGELIEVPYTSELSSDRFQTLLRELGTTPDIRRLSLRRLLAAKPMLRFLEAHSGLTALIVENACVTTAEGMRSEFDGIWASSLTESTAKGKPDIEAVDVSARMQTLNDVIEVTTKPLIYDADTGGLVEHFQFTVRTLERLGVSAAIIEDKTGLKKNSLLGNDVSQTQDSIEQFSRKISAGKRAQVTHDFMIIARIESLILEAGMEDAITRAQEYIKAGADGIMIHSRKSNPDEIFEFCGRFKKFGEDVPLVVVPSTFNSVTELELRNHGVNMVIYANHLLRAAYPAMMRVAESILTFGRSSEVDAELLPIKEILQLVPGTH